MAHLPSETPSRQKSWKSTRTRDPFKFCVEGVAYERLVAFLTSLKMVQAHGNQIVPADFLVVDHPTEEPHFTLISAAAEMGKRVAVIAGQPELGAGNYFSGVDSQGVEWFPDIAAFEEYLREEQDVTIVSTMGMSLQQMRAEIIRRREKAVIV